jgi:hypothetical protein
MGSEIEKEKPRIAMLGVYNVVLFVAATFSM